MAKNHYETLGVSKTATQDEIKSAYRKLVKQYHPDLHPNDPACAEKFKEINEAHEILSDEKKRKEYDFQLEHPNMGGFGGFGGGGFSGAGFDFGDIFGDIFGSFTGGGRRTQTKTPGQDITIEVTLSFLDAAKGCHRDVTYSRNQTCTSCSGTGAKGGTSYKTCDKCKGTGQVQYVNNSGIFRQVSVRPCDECNGTGKKIIDACPDCKGKGYTKTNTTVSLDIPAGADNGSYMTKRGYGEASKNGGVPGDLIVVFKVEPSKIFTRKKFDLYVEVPVSYKTAVLGGKVEVPTLDDTFTYTIPEGTQNGKIFCIRGKGIKTSRGTGDLYITVTVEIPTKISRDQRKKLIAFDDELEVKQYEKLKKYKDSIEKSYGVNPYKE